MVDLSYVDNLPPSEAEVVSNVAVTTGCFSNGQVGLYVTEPLASQDGLLTIQMDRVSVEVRN